jgi:putative transposase
MLQRVAEEYDMVIDTMDIVEDHVHVFLEAPPRLSPSRIVQILKSISAESCFDSLPGCGGSYGEVSWGAMATLYGW